jgi:hypothetical protein
MLGSWKKRVALEVGILLACPALLLAQHRGNGGQREVRQPPARQERSTPRAQPKNNYENRNNGMRERQPEYRPAPPNRTWSRPEPRYQPQPRYNPQPRYDSQPRYVPQPQSREVPRPPQTVPRPGHSGNWLNQYRNVPPAQQERALEQDPQFRSLPPQRQQQLRQRLQKFSSLPPQQQERILNRMETWEHLTPEQKQTARGLYQQMQKLPPGRRDMVENAIRDLRQMSPEQRQEALSSPRYRNTFTSQERNMLNGITQLPLAPAPQESEEQR